jgi:hypothetical protein
MFWALPKPDPLVIAGKAPNFAILARSPQVFNPGREQGGPARLSPGPPPVVNPVFMLSVLR